MTQRNLLMLVVLSGCLGISPLVGAETTKQERQVSVQGRGKVSAPPDLARLWVQVSEEGPRLDAVNQQVRQKMGEILKALKGQGIAEKDIQTQMFQINPKYEWRNGRSNRIGFVVSNQVAVTVRDLKKTGSVLAAALDAGANNVNGPQFEIENPQALERNALNMALQDAKAKAKLLAEAAGVSLGDVLSIQETGINRPGPRPLMMRASAVAMERAASEEPIASGEETVEANVSASFALR